MAKLKKLNSLDISGGASISFVVDKNGNLAPVGNASSSQLFQYVVKNDDGSPFIQNGTVILATDPNLLSQNPTSIAAFKSTNGSGSGV